MFLTTIKTKLVLAAWTAVTLFGPVDAFAWYVKQDNRPVAELELMTSKELAAEAVGPCLVYVISNTTVQILTELQDLENALVYSKLQLDSINYIPQSRSSHERPMVANRQIGQ